MFISSPRDVTIESSCENQFDDPYTYFDVANKRDKQTSTKSSEVEKEIGTISRKLKSLADEMDALQTEMSINRETIKHYKKIFHSTENERSVHDDPVAVLTRRIEQCEHEYSRIQHLRYSLLNEMHILQFKSVG